MQNQNQNQGKSLFQKIGGWFAVLVTGIGGMLCLLLLAVASIVWLMNTLSTENYKGNGYDNSVRGRETSLSAMRQKLINMSGCNKDFADNFIKNTVAISDGRKGGSVFKMVTEAAGAPQGFNPELAMKMMNAIEGNISEFKRAQDMMLERYNDHKTFCTDPWRRWLIGGKVKPEPIIVSSGDTKEAVKTGLMSDEITVPKKETPVEK
jgi:hypothetical protein